MGVHGMLVRPLAELMSCQMISFAVSGSSGGVGMGGKVVEFGDSIVRALRHGVLSRNKSAGDPETLFQMLFRPGLCVQNNRGARHLS